MTFDSDIHRDIMTGLYCYEILHRFMSAPAWSIERSQFECEMISECVSGTASTREDASAAIQRWIADRATRHAEAAK